LREILERREDGSGARLRAGKVQTGLEEIVKDVQRLEKGE